MNERDLFLSALEIDDPAARRAHLQLACADNGELLSRVESLLASHEGESRFLQTPVGEQLGDDPTGQAAATLVMGTGSTHDESPSGEAAGILEFSQLQERVKMADETPLGYLEPSTKPGSLGRLAHYEILEVIGQGAFGTVLRAFDEKLQRVVAIKVMAPELAATSPARKRFVREAQASAQIRHENVVSVYSVEEKPIPYLVMEYIPGETLQHRLDERGPLDVPTVLRLGTQIAEGLAAAHAKDLIHRDIKPGNILLETGLRDRVKITDFGLARAADDASMSQSGVIAGTPMYMAPEQALGHKLDQRADLFSLGSVVYQMVSGRPPFRASSTLAVLKRLTEETPRPIQEIIPETPRWLCDIISKLHAKNPDDRFQTAKEVAELLEQHLAHLQNPSQVIRPAAVSLAPAAKAPAGPEMRPLMVPQGIRWPLLIATAIMFLIAVLLLAITESTGVTHLFTGSGVVQEPPPNAPKAELVFGEDSLPGKWVQLFNGQDLDGWVRHTDFPGNWRVEEGILVGSGPARMGLLHSARKDIGDFHLRAEVFINSEQADGGISFRSLPQSSNELNLCFDPKLPTQQTGSLVIHKPGTKDSTWYSAPRSLAKANEWMTVEIISQGNQATTKINGQTAAISQALCGNPRGHIMLQHLGPQTVVRFRKIEIKELPSSDSSGEAASHRFASNEWFDVIPLIDPRLDKHGNKLTGRNEWRVDNGELVVGYADEKPNKLLLPLDSDWQAFECELDFTRRTGESAFGLNFPVKQSDVPLVVDLTGRQVSLGRRAVIGEIDPIPNGERAKISVRARKQDGTDHLEVAVNGKSVGTWTGNRSAIEGISGEGYAHARRLSLWIPGGSEYDFHQIRIRMLDGGTAETLRPVPRTTQLAAPPPAIAPFDAAQAKVHQTAWAKHLGVPVEYSNSLGMKLRLIPPASAMLPIPYYLGQYEVTQGEWAKVMGYNPSEFGSQMEAKETSALPVEMVGWFDSVEFCNKLSEREGLKPFYELTATKRGGKDGKQIDAAEVKILGGDGYHLPGDAEWAHGCAAGTNAKYHFGDREEDLPEYAWFVKNSEGRTHAVGEKKPNAFGLHDTHGNVREWVGEILTEAVLGFTRVSRGGHFRFPAIHCTVTHPNYNDPAQRYDYLGLRVARGTRGAPSPEAKTPPVAVAPFTDADVQRIAALPAAEQIEQVRKELKRLNSDFDGTVTHKIENDVVTELQVVTDNVTDISPIRVFNSLRVLDCSGTQGPNNLRANGQLADLTPLKGMNLAHLTRLNVRCTKVGDADMALFKDCKRLTELGLYATQVSDAGLAYFHDCKQLKTLNLAGTKVTDTGLAGFKDCTSLTVLYLSGLKVSDVGLSYFKDCKDLRLLFVGGPNVTDTGLAHFKDCKNLTRLSIAGSKVTDLSLLKEMPLIELACDFKRERDAEILRSIKTLKTINGKPADQFWKDVQAGKSSFLPFTDADVQRIAALSAPEQVEEVRKELKRRNPGLDGTAKHKIEGGVVTEFVFTPIKGQDALTDLSPVRALVGLTYLNLWGCSELENLEPLKGLKLTRLTLGSLNVNLQVRDLEPLRGMKLTELRLYRCQVQDLEPLQDMPLTTLSLFSRQVRDCGPLRGMPLTTLGLANCSQIEDFTPLKDLPLTILHLNDCQVRDLEPFKGMKLTGLHLVGTPVRDLELLKGMPLKYLAIFQKPGVTDLRPLQGMELEEIYLTPKNITQGLEILRGMKSLKTIGIAYSQSWPAAEFWERYDKGEFKE